MVWFLFERKHTGIYKRTTCHTMKADYRSKAEELEERLAQAVHQK